MYRKETRSILLMMLVGLFTFQANAQKKPLDHSVYDGWQNISSSGISKDGKVIYYVVSPQEGDALLHVKGTGNNQIGTVARAASVQFSPEEGHLLMLVKPLFAETRAARIKKKKPDEMPKDSLAVVDIRDGSVYKAPAVKSFKAPEEQGTHIAYLAEQPVEPEQSADEGESKAKPSSQQVLVLYHLNSGVDTSFVRVDSYYFSKDGKDLYFVRQADKKDSLAADAGLYHYNIAARAAKRISSGKGDYKQLVISDDGRQVAFLAYKGPEKAQIKSFDVYHFNAQGDSARVLVHARTAGVPQAWHVGDNGSLKFSNDGDRLFFGLAPVPAVKDTTLVEFEHAKVDIWHWKEDYLQTQQLVNLRRDQNRSYLAVVNLSGNGRVVPLANERIMDVILPEQGDQEYVLGTDDFGKRVSYQWKASTSPDIYLISTRTGEPKLITEEMRGSVVFSPQGKYVLWFERASANWYVYDVAAGTQRQLNQGVPVSFANEDNDSPDDPNSYGVAGWGKNDEAVYLNDKYDIWAFDLGKGTFRSLTNGYGRDNQITFRYRNLQDPASQRIFGRSATAEPMDPSKSLLLSAFDHVSKENGWFKSNPRNGRNPESVVMTTYSYGQAKGAENAGVFIYTKENYQHSPDLYVSSDFKTETALSALNPQQANYNWGTAELYKWTTTNGHDGVGIVYKPEDFDPNKKYPVIAYFYETLSDGLYSYIPPGPTPSRLNISYFVSNGYIVFAPDIIYEIGYPGRSAEEYVNSGMSELAKLPWVDASKLAIQGQSWGGYQVAHLITRTDMYAAAWSGAPVVNMTSAYGGIRWQTGMNRQFQYEHTQSRIGATLWEKPELYIENSPLFHLPNVNTPVVIMHNDEDGAVPWYQGIEMFTALRRLEKPVWMLNYNGDAHNLVLRQNRKDIQRRQQEFFDHFLKGKPAAPWIEHGVPAIRKGIDWGFGN